MVKKIQIYLLNHSYTSFLFLKFSFSHLVNNGIFESVNDVFSILHGQTHWWLNSHCVTIGASLTEK